MKNLKKLHKQRGFSLVELAISMGLIAVFISGIMVWRGNVSESQKLNDLTQSVTFMTSGIQRLYSGQYADGSDMTKAVSKSGLVKPPLVSSGDTIKDEYNNDVTVTGKGYYFDVTLNTSAGQVQRCRDIAGLLADSALKLTIGGKTVKDALLSSNATKDIEAIGEGCVEDAANILIFSYK